MQGFSGTPSRRKEELFEDLRRLSQVSQSIEKVGNSLSAVQNMLQFSQMKEKLDSLSREQAALVKRFVDSSPDQEARLTFERLTRVIEETQTRMKSCRDSNELARMQKEVEEVIDRWVELFKSIVISVVSSSLK